MIKILKKDFISKKSLAKQAQKNKKLGSFKIKMRKFGAFLAGLILPAIGPIIAWGLWTSLFLYNYDSHVALGWVKHDATSRALGKLVGPGINYMIPLLIAYNGGRMIYGIRGGMIAAFSIMATIVGGEYLIPQFTKDWNHMGPTSAPAQFIGAMFIGPLSALFLLKFEKIYLHKISSSFEMLVKNFGIGIFGLFIGMIGFWGWSPVMWSIQLGLTKFIKIFADNNLTWTLGFFTEPIKVTFLNNALNHGVMGPLGYTQVSDMIASGASHPRSIFFLFDPNPGPGMGMLLAYIIWSRGQNRTNAMGSSIIHFFGGIHEVYFVFILAKPIMVLSTTAGVVSAQAWTLLMGGGTSATPSPGSIISLISLSPGVHALWVNLVSVLIGTAVSFGVATAILLFNKKHSNSEGLKINFSDEGISFEDEKQNTSNIKNDNKKLKNIKKIIIACEAGLGSSAMATGIVKKLVQNIDKKIIVDHAPYRDVPKDADILITMKSFEDLLKKSYPTKPVYSVKSFINKSEYKNLLSDIKKANKNGK